MLGLFILIWRIVVQAVVADQSTTCFVNNVKCDISEDTLIDVYLETTWQECSVLCQDEKKCSAFNFFGPESNFHPRNSCLLFSACFKKSPCNDCVIGTNQDDCTCSIGFYGEIDESNFIDMAASVPDEVACKNLCSKTTQCAFYTFYNSRDPHQPEVCILLSNSGIEKSQIDNSKKSGLRSSAKKCDNCKTGPVTCQFNEKCKVALLTTDNGHCAHPYIFAYSAEVRLITGEKSCFRDLRALAIGGGGSAQPHPIGSGDPNEWTGGGGGSGHPKLGLFQLRSNETLNLTVGRGRETKIEKDGLELLVAAAGQKCNGYSGGDGYSGGGAGPRPPYHNRNQDGQDGGSNGSDGHGHGQGHGTGGKGSGLDLATLNMTRFILTPGNAGTGVYSYGGGGGGILVNGKKPRGGRDGLGKGFGGGGGGHNPFYWNWDGFPGCVLIEI